MPMTPPILTNEGVGNYLRVLERKVGIPDHGDMTIFQLADKFTLTKTGTSRLDVWFFLIAFHVDVRKEGRGTNSKVGRNTEWEARFFSYSIYKAFKFPWKYWYS